MWLVSLVPLTHTNSTPSALRLIPVAAQKERRSSMSKPYAVAMAIVAVRARRPLMSRAYRPSNPAPSNPPESARSPGVVPQAERQIAVNANDGAITQSQSNRCDHDVNCLHRTTAAKEFGMKPAIFEGGASIERPILERVQYQFESFHVLFTG